MFTVVGGRALVALGLRRSGGHVSVLVVILLTTIIADHHLCTKDMEHVSGVPAWPVLQQYHAMADIR